MKQITLNLYHFEELSEDVRKKIIEEKTFDIAYDVMDFYSDEYEATLAAFEKLMGIKVSYEVSYCGCYFYFRFDNDEVMGDYCGKKIYADDCSGKLLRRYLNNNFIPYALNAKKYVKFNAGYDDKNHRWNKQRYSRISVQDWRDCPLTGTCYDHSILEKVFKTLSKPIPDSYSLKDLVWDALNNFFKDWRAEYEYWCENQENCIEEEILERYSDKLFYKDGRMFV